MAVDALIFDCDGVLIDHEMLVCRIAAEELTKVRYAISTEQVIARFAGRPNHEMRAEIESDALSRIPLGKTSMRGSMKRMGNSCKTMPGMKEALDKIKLPVCAASSSFPESFSLDCKP